MKATSTHLDDTNLTSKDIGQPLLQWYDRNSRPLSWRPSPSSYATLVAEFMLQQTQAAAVEPYYRRFLSRFPTLEALAVASELEVCSVWAGLGYYSRARAIRRLAQVVVEQYEGQIPSDPVLLRRLPGVGCYTAGAIASIAFGVRVPAVDGNVSRVVARLFQIAGNPRKSGRVRNQILEIAHRILPERRVGDFNQAMMDLGATICLPLRPRCSECPLADRCRAYINGNPAQYPERLESRLIVEQTHVSAMIRRENGDLLLCQRPNGGWWAGMWEMPRVVCHDGEGVLAAAVRAGIEVVGMHLTPHEIVANISHTVTHHRIQLYVITAVGDGDPVPIGCSRIRWAQPDQFHELAITSPQRRALKAVGLWTALD
ncbi:MAG: A/G-specific adenine glycosylase [Armatimonadetes bacterium]|nr:A/G-specific adenine glycosylase [Armatimonadota bacterium]